jgi:hypothetical protein
MKYDLSLRSPPATAPPSNLDRTWIVGTEMPAALRGYLMQMGEFTPEASYQAHLLGWLYRWRGSERA